MQISLAFVPRVFKCYKVDQYTQEKKDLILTQYDRDWTNWDPQIK